MRIHPGNHNEHHNQHHQTHPQNRTSLQVDNGLKFLTVRKTLLLLTVLLTACGGEGMGADDMDGIRWAGKPTLGRTSTLATTFAHLGIVPTLFGPDTQDLQVGVNLADKEQSRVFGFNSQLRLSNDNPVSGDVMLDIEYGSDSGTQKAYIKVGNGVSFNLTAQFIKLIARNLGGPAIVTTSAVPHAIPISSPGSPHWSFRMRQVAPFWNPFSVERLQDLFSPALAPAGVPPSMINRTPAPYIIPPFADNVSISLVGTPGTVYFLTQGWDTHNLRVDSVTLDATGFGLFDRIPIYGLTSFLNINEGTFNGNIATQVDVAFDFGLSL